MCPTAPAPVNQGVANVAGHEPGVSDPTSPTARRNVDISVHVTRFSDPASRSRRVRLRVTHGVSLYFPEPRSPCSPVSHTHTILLRAV
jgi:hypothetical protein